MLAQGLAVVAHELPERCAGEVPPERCQPNISVVLPLSWAFLIIETSPCSLIPSLSWSVWQRPISSPLRRGCGGMIPAYRPGDRVELHGEEFEVSSYQREGMPGYWLLKGSREELFWAVDLERVLRPTE